ncbi:MAG TPA: ABC transporter permease [Acidimicrobiia bacterium]|nr:ABC transporter permease [Acidimicrobiia bacterium]
MNRRSPLVWAVAWVGISFLALPLVALVARVPWARLAEILASSAARSALWVSLQVSVTALVVSVVLGTPLAWVFARRDFRGRSLLRTLALLPMVLPPVVAGVALLLAFGRRGILGQHLEALAGVIIPFTRTAAVLAAGFVAMPFFVSSAEAGFASLARGYEEAAATLGVGRWRRFRRVVLPMVAPNLAAGAAMAWARALGEFGATITFAGNVPGVTQTMPLAVYLQLEQDPEAAFVLAVVLLAISVMVLAGARAFGRSR